METRAIETDDLGRIWGDFMLKTRKKGENSLRKYFYL